MTNYKKVSFCWDYLRKTVFFAVFFGLSLAFAQKQTPPQKVEIPYCAGVHAAQTGAQAADHELRDFFAFSICYREHYELAEWAAYEIIWKELENPAKRKNDFRSDPLISTGSASLEDYRKSGFDRGHLVPAADMAFDERAMSESFYLSNMSPQNPSFNRGVWLKLETQTRAWAKKFGAIRVITGPVLEKETYKTIGENAVAVPEFFYKIILAQVNGEWQAIGFIIPNEGQTEPLSFFAVPIRDIEARTGLDFFYKLPPDVQDSIETAVRVELWQ